MITGIEDGMVVSKHRTVRPAKKFFMAQSSTATELGLKEGVGVN